MLHNPGSLIYVPDKTPLPEALERSTHMAIAAHPDDLEIMAYHGISDCFGCNDRWFLGVILTHGAGSPRGGMYSEISNEEMRRIRRKEQIKAASIGEYGAVAMLDYPSDMVKGLPNKDLIADLQTLLTAARPDTLYLHNPFDRHSTHVGAVVRCIEALLGLPVELRPQRVIGCEVWRSLDWLPDRDKILLDVSRYPHLAQALLGVFDSQISGGKRYDQAAQGRRIANATFEETHVIDQTEALTIAVDLSPLIRPPYPSLDVWTKSLLDRFEEEVLSQIHALC